jgi:hypothetical protein
MAQPHKPVYQFGLVDLLCLVFVCGFVLTLAFKHTDRAILWFDLGVVGVFAIFVAYCALRHRVKNSPDDK